MKRSPRKSTPKLVSALLIISIGIILSDIMFPNLLSRADAREELLNLHGQLVLGQIQPEVEHVFQNGAYKHLRLVMVSDCLWIVQTPFETGAVNWELRLTFDGASLTAFRIRTADSKDALHPDAPRDVEI